MFVAGRKPGKLSIIDTASGKLVKTMDCIDIADDMTFDPAEGRIYVTGSGGITVLHEDGPDSYSILTQFATNAGKTSIYDAALHQLYVVHTKPRG